MKFSKMISEKFIKRLLAMVLLAAVLAVVFGKSLPTRALFDPDKAITYQTFASRTTVENSVLFIGTYIVHKDALTDDIYEKAKNSAAESAQENIYYKSELADGEWFEIGSIDNGIKGISTEGLPESIDTINPLYVTYYVGADGIMKDAKTMAGVNPFDIPDPYDLAGLPELDPIRNQYTMSSASSISQADYLENKSSQDTGNLRSDVYYYQLLSTFFSLDLRDAETNRCDDTLSRLNSAYISLKAAGQDEEAALVYDLMSKVDARRRLLIMERLSELDDNLLSKLLDLASGTYYTPYGDFKDSSSEADRSSQPDYQIELEDSLKREYASSSTSASSFVNAWLDRLGITTSSSGWWTVLDRYQEDKDRRRDEANEDNDDFVADQTPAEYPFAVDSAMVDAIGQAMGKCADSAATYRGKALVDTKDLLGHVIYDYSNQVIDQTTGGGVGGPIDFLKHASNIKEDIISDKEGEKNLLNSSLLPMATDRYQTSAKAGAGAEYLQASSEGAKKTALEQQKTDEEVDRAMMQYLIEAYRKRSDAADALAYVKEKIAEAEGWLEDIPSDEYKAYSTSSVQAFISWLKEEADMIVNSDDSLKSKLDELREKKEDLQNKRDNCLDNNDLAGAAKYDALIAAVDQDIDREANGLSGGSGSGSGSEGGSGSGTGGAGGAGSGSGSGSDLDKMTDKLVDKALSKLADDQNADLSGIADALAGVGAEDELDALMKKAADSGASANTLAGIKDAKDSLSASKTSPDSDALLGELEALFGKSLDDMDENELAVAGATVSRLSRMGIVPAESLTKKIVNKLVETNNRFTYAQYSQSKSVEYINMETISDCTDYRYFYDDTKATATMTKGSRIYIFKRGSDRMYKQSSNSEGEMMAEKIVYSGSVYISEDDAKTYFECDAEYAYKTDYAICLTAPKQTAVEEYTKALSEFFKE